MSGLKGVRRILLTTAVVAAVVGCAFPQGSARQGGQVMTIDERIASLTEAERDELQRSMAVPQGSDPETKAARDAFLAWLAGRDRAQDYEREAGPMGGMGYTAR